MAARFTTEEVLEEVLRDEEEECSEEECSGDEQEKNEVDSEEERVRSWIDSFELKQGSRKEYFKEKALEVLLPVIHQASSYSEDNSRLTATQFLMTTNISAASVLDEEGRLWVDLIHKRLAGRVSVRQPYYAEIHRTMPFTFFHALTMIIKESHEFQEPSCYIGSNRKGEVISFTTLSSLQRLFTCITELNAKEIKKYFSRKLKSFKRYNHKVQVIVEERKDFAFVFRKKKGQLTIQFHYGEWNKFDYPQHPCMLEI